MKDIFREIREGLDELRVIDIHSHLGSRGIWQARDLAHLVSYHWLSVELARAKGGQIEADPTEAPDDYMSEAVPHFPAIRNTVNHYALMAMLRDLYGLQDRTLTEDNWRDVDARVREAAADPDRFVKVLDRCNIDRVFVGYDAPRSPNEASGSHNGGVRWKEGHSEGGDKAGSRKKCRRCVPYGYGEPMFAFEHPSQAGAILGKGAEPPETLDELAEGIGKHIEYLAKERKVRALHNWVRGTWVYRDDVAPEEAAAIYGRVIAREEVPQEERDRLMSFTADVTAEEAGKEGMTIQIFHGMIAYTRGRGVPCMVHFNPQFIPALTKHFWRHGRTRYDLFYGTRTASHELASLARVYPNVSVSGAWWHGFSPTTLSEFFRDRLELLPNTAWNAFYSDGYMVEWLYGKLAVTKNRLAHALAGMVDEGFITRDDALDIARKLFYDNPVEIYGLD